MILSHNSILFSNCTRPSFIIRSELQQKQFYSSWISLLKSYRTLVILEYRLLVRNCSITNSQLWVISLYSCKFTPTCTNRCCGIVNCILASQSEWKYLDFAFLSIGATSIHWTSLTPWKRKLYWKKKLTHKQYRFCAYKMFINIISCSDMNRHVRYILPACVVSRIREKFPNLDGTPYTGYFLLKTFNYYHQYIIHVIFVIL
jgi:hypothetical protein